MYIIKHFSQPGSPSVSFAKTKHRYTIPIGIPDYYQFNRFQSVMNAAARLVFSASRYDHITTLLRQLHWLKAPE